MICPKCGHHNDQDISCTRCGVIFEKYVQFQQRQRDHEREQWEREDRRKKTLLMGGGGALAVLLLIGLFLLSPTDTTEQSTITQQAQNTRRMGFAPWERGNAPGYWEQDGDQLRWVSTPDQSILSELSSKFVSVGNRAKGGILITDDCHVIYSGEPSQNSSSRAATNNHHLQAEYDRLQGDLDRAKQAFETKRLEFANTCKVCDDESFRRVLYKQISRVEKAEEKLSRARERLDSSNEQLERDRQLRVDVNNTSVTARVIQVSDNHPLSLLLLDKRICESPKIGDPALLQEGDSVFAFAGYRRDRLIGGKYGGISRQPDATEYLLHDIKLNKGDLGTPLFDQEGRVIGITVTPLDGKPRAIPIGQALRELNLLI